MAVMTSRKQLEPGGSWEPHFHSEIFIAEKNACICLSCNGGSHLRRPHDTESNHTSFEYPSECFVLQTERKKMQDGVLRDFKRQSEKLEKRKHE